MRTRKKIILFVIYAVVFTVLVTYITLPEQLRAIERSIEVQTNVDIEKTKLFEIMADVKNYPYFLPENYVSVQILDKTGNSIRSLETAKEAGIQTTFTVKHTLIPYESHQMTILDGDAEGTNIFLWFDDFDVNKTTISVKLDLKLKGIMMPFSIISHHNVKSALDTALNSFIENSDVFEIKKIESIISKYYNEYLNRSPDKADIQFWKNAVLKDGMTLEWVEAQIRNSPEALELNK